MPLIDKLLGPLDAKTDPRAVALVRIAMGLVGLLAVLVTHRDVVLFAEPGTLRYPLFDWLPQLHPGNLWPYTAVGILASAGFTVGFFTRTSGALMVLCMLYRHALDWGFYQNYTALLVLFSALLILGNAGAAHSIDALRRGGTVPLVPLWPQTLIKFQVSVVYFYTAVGKVNTDFLKGDVFAASFTVLHPFGHPMLWHAIAVATILLELGLAFLLWVPRIRPWAILVGTLLHIGILFGLGFYAALIAFSVEFIAIYLLFVDYRPGSYLVVWDDDCGFCWNWVNWFRRLDWLDVLRFEGSSDKNSLARLGIPPEEAAREVKLVVGERIYGGFEAVREIFAILPLTLAAEPLLRLPPIRMMGHRYYRKVAKHRKFVLPPWPWG